MKETKYEYRDITGKVIGVITRMDDVDGEKTFRASVGFPNPRPLYNLDQLAARPQAPVLVVEGEKTADAATKLLPDFVVTTSPFGAKSAGKADWHVLDGRNTVIWPDHDEEGRAYAGDVARLVPGAKGVTVPDGFPAKWDLADKLPAGVTIEGLIGLLLMAETPKTKAKKKPSKADLRASVDEVKRERDAAIGKIRALISKTIANGCTEAEADAAFAKAKELMDEHGIGEADLREQPEPTFDDIGADLDGDAVLNAVYAFYGRFISYPSQHARVAHTLWTAHTHMMDIWDSTPRMSFMSPEPKSGKTRALEITECLVPRPVHSVNNSVAYMIRRIADESGRPTILYDEVDALFANKAPDKADLIALLNAGHRKGATSGRCVVGGAGGIRLEDLPAYCALALAGLKDLPDALATRAILIEMKRRAPGEKIEPFRERIHRAQARPVCDDLTDWCAHTAPRIAGKYPDMPAEITDRDADCWEPLLAIAEAAGGDWPECAREAAVYLVRRGQENIRTSGIELLEHIREAFGEEDRLWTEKLLDRLVNRDESPWADIRGKPLTDRGLADRLKPYKIKSTQVRIGELNRQGYMAADFKDAWNRYLKNKDPARSSPYRPYKPYIFDNKTNFVGDVGDVGDRSVVGDGVCQACDGNYGKGCPTCRPENYGLPPKVKPAEAHQ